MTVIFIICGLRSIIFKKGQNCTKEYFAHICVCKQGALLWPPWHGLAACLNIWLCITELPKFWTFYDTIYVAFFEDYQPKTTNYDQSTLKTTLYRPQQNRGKETIFKIMVGRINVSICNVSLGNQNWHKHIERMKFTSIISPSPYTYILIFFPYKLTIEVLYERKSIKQQERFFFRNKFFHYIL